MATDRDFKQELDTLKLEVTQWKKTGNPIRDNPNQVPLEEIRIHINDGVVLANQSIDLVCEKFYQKTGSLISDDNYIQKMDDALDNLTQWMNSSIPTN